MRALLCLPLAAALSGADWPQFRGHGGAGLCPECGPMPVEFGPSRNAVWKTPVPMGKSSPVLIADRIFLTAAEGHDLITLCLDRATGRELWRRAVRAPRQETRNALNHSAAPPPVTDGRRVFAFFADFGLVAYALDGKQL
ncbi:MAG: hypothetical protein JNK48_00385, partial [Bryobacterales bacterium]|nr:hypothetical protein [Bryobacterales bacterium]